LNVVEKGDVNGRKSKFEGRGVDFRSASVLSRGVRRAASPTVFAPINHVAKVSFPIYHTSRSEQNSLLFF